MKAIREDKGLKRQLDIPGKAQAGSTCLEIILDPRHVPPDPVSFAYYLDYWFLFISGPNEGMWRIVVYSNANKVTMECSFPCKVQEGDEYLIRRKHSTKKDE